MKRIAVFCGSSSGLDKRYELNAKVLGKKLALKEIDIVYGGASVGLMGALANGAISEGGKVIGVLPNFLKHKEITHLNLSQLIIVDSMHERKAKMHELSDGFIALPGGFGTLEEVFEVLTLAQLGLHQKPIALVNVGGYYNNLLQFVEQMVTKGFLKKAFKDMIIVSENIDDILVKFTNYRPPTIGKWPKT